MEFMALPDKRMTFDVDRPVRLFEHLMKDYTDGPTGRGVTISGRPSRRSWASLIPAGLKDVSIGRYRR